jgi:hypothetical protein
MRIEAPDLEEPVHAEGVYDRVESSNAAKQGEGSGSCDEAVFYGWFHGAGSPIYLIRTGNR